MFSISIRLQSLTLRLTAAAALTEKSPTASGGRSREGTFRLAVKICNELPRECPQILGTAIRECHRFILLLHRFYDIIELLNTAFENMATHLHEREKELRFSANRDSLTGLRNTTSYKNWVAEFDKEIKNNTAKFGVAVFDLNQLKETNDTYGHDVGDKLIKTAAKTIADVFKRSPVFRIGGDEFLAVLQHRDLEACKELFAKLDSVCANTFIEEKVDSPISIARGFAMFDADKDLCFNDVFKRADNAMYKNKRENKKVND